MGLAPWLLVTDIEHHTIFIMRVCLKILKNVHKVIGEYTHSGKMHIE